MRVGRGAKEVVGTPGWIPIVLRLAEVMRLVYLGDRPGAMHQEHQKDQQHLGRRKPARSGLILRRVFHGIYLRRWLPTAACFPMIAAKAAMARASPALACFACRLLYSESTGPGPRTERGNDGAAIPRQAAA